MSELRTSTAAPSQQSRRSYEAPSLSRLSLSATQGGNSPHCDQACGPTAPPTYIDDFS